MPIISKETWEKFDPTEQKEIRELYSSLKEAVKQEQIGSEEHLRLSSLQDRYIFLFGKEQLQPQPLTYEDVARELFKNGAYQFREYRSIGIDDTIFQPNAGEEYLLNFTSAKQAEKLLSINKLLNVAAYLNQSWKPDWDNDAQPKWHIYINYTSLNNDLEIEENYQDCFAPVYFRTEELARQAVEILGEDTVRLALTTEY